MTGQSPYPEPAFVRRHRIRLVEALPWLAIGGWYFAFPGYEALGSQILVMILFALSLDLILGFTGIVTLGHAAFFGTGAYTAAILVRAGWTEPVSGLIIAAAAAGLVGLISGWILLRTHGLTLLMLTLATTVLLGEVANSRDDITGGSDGLLFRADPLFGVFEFSIWYRMEYWYAAAVLFVMFVIARILVHSSFGHSLVGIRENTARMHAIGANVRGRMVAIYTISAAMAGVAGAVLAQTNQTVALYTLGFPISGTVLIMLVLGGTGRLYGAFVGAFVYMILEDRLPEWDPLALIFGLWDGIFSAGVLEWYAANHRPQTLWPFWIGLLLVLTVLFARRGLLGLIEDGAAWVRKRVGGGGG